MNWYKLEDIEKLAADNGMHTLLYGDCIHIFLGDFRISVFQRKPQSATIYKLLYTYTKIIKCSGPSLVRPLGIDITDSVSGKRFFGNLYTVYENMNKKYKELLKMIKAAEIKTCGGNYEV